MRFYRIKINDLYLTSSGLIGGIPCELSISGVSDLLQTFTGSVQFAVDGTPIMQMFETGTRGKIIEIKVTRLYQSVWNSLIEIINNALDSEETINIVGAGDIGNFDLEFLPLLPKPFEASEFSNTRIENVILRFVSV